MMIVPILCYRCFSSRQSRTFRCRDSGQSEEPNKLKNGDAHMCPALEFSGLRDHSSDCRAPNDNRRTRTDSIRWQTTAPRPTAFCLCSSLKWEFGNQLSESFAFTPKSTPFT
jgi:hypothetical protein